MFNKTNLMYFYLKWIRAAKHRSKLLHVKDVNWADIFRGSSHAPCSGWAVCFDESAAERLGLICTLNPFNTSVSRSTLISFRKQHTSDLWRLSVQFFLWRSSSHDPAFNNRQEAETVKRCLHGPVSQSQILQTEQTALESSCRAALLLPRNLVSSFWSAPSHG